MKNYFMVSSVEGRLGDTDEGDGGMQDALHQWWANFFRSGPKKKIWRAI